MAKTGYKSATKTVESISPERRWTVISSETGKRIYMPSEKGIDKAEAERQARSLLIATRVVPEAALDQFGFLLEDRLEEAIATAEAEE